MKKIKVQIKGREKMVVKLLKGLRVDIYDIFHKNESSIYLIKEEDLKKIPKGLILNKSLSLKDKVFLHKEFIISIFLSLLLFTFLSHIIFSVKIMHNDKYIREITKDELNKYGLKPLRFRKSYKQIEKIKKNMLNDYKDDFEWIEIESKGMAYIVRVEKRIITKEKRVDKYCDIVSKKDAVIRRIDSFKGQNKLDTGDYVLKGQTIVGGDIVFNEEVKSRVCADAKVIGNTWYNVNIKYPKFINKKVYTGKKSYNLAFSFNNKKITNIFKVHFNNYDLKNTQILKIGKLRIYKVKSLEYNLQRIKLKKNEAKSRALSLANKRLLESLSTNPKIISRNVLQSYEYNSIINMDIFYSVDEVISKQVIKSVPDEKEEKDEIT